MGLKKTPYIIIFLGLGPITNIWKIEIIDYEVGVGVNF
jgi:hypothetical protein